MKCKIVGNKFYHLLVVTYMQDGARLVHHVRSKPLKNGHSRESDGDLQRKVKKHFSQTKNNY